MLDLFCLPLICNILFLDQENKYEEEWLVGFHCNFFVLPREQTLPPALAFGAPGTPLWGAAAVQWPGTLWGAGAVDFHAAQEWVVVGGRPFPRQTVGTARVP